MTNTTSENERLKELEKYQVLDTPAEQDFDELASLASQICGTPISLISLIDKNRQWFKSKVGLTLPETPRSVSFCAQAINQNNIFEVEDASEDKRFQDNPFVTAAPNIRFYAGAPLITGNGYKLGTLCVIDTVPRHLTQEQRYALEVLAKQVVTNLELRNRQRQLEQEKAQLREANEKLDQFVHMVSHDLKEPIMNMEAVSEWLQDDLAAADYGNVASNLHLLKERISTMESLVNGLLDYATTQVGNLPKEKVQVKQLLEQLVSEQESGKHFTVTIAPGMPVLHTERILLQQVFANLLSNAFKYHHTGRGNVWVEAQEKEQEYTFLVKDDGPGIAPQHHERIFGLYERLLRDSGRTKGSGIGLATVKRIVEDKGGRIWVDSEVGRGSTFYFTWPK